MKRKTRKWNSGFTLVETGIAIALLLIIFLGSVQYILVSRSRISATAHSLKAWNTILNRFEYALTINYCSISDSLSEVGTRLDWDDLDSYRTTIIKAVDDPLDGSAPADTILPDYLEMSVKISRFTVENYTDSASIFITPERNG